MLIYTNKIKLYHINTDSNEIKSIKLLVCLSFLVSFTIRFMCNHISSSISFEFLLFLFPLPETFDTLRLLKERSFSTCDVP